MARKRKKKKASRFTAATADRFELYEGSVYDPEADHDFLVKTFQKRRKRRPLTLREDFAGTSLLSSLWIQNHGKTKAWAVDLDSAPLAYGKTKHIEPLGDNAERVVQLEENVLSVETPKVDVLTAFNFSYWIFEQRAVMLDYFRKVLGSLEDDGMFVVDLMGGPGVQQPCEEPREEDGGFTYVWEQEVMDAITHHIDCHIHFEFEDGTRMDKAFTYNWRVWSMAELRDIMLDAGFAKVDAYWEGTDKHGEGDGVFKKASNADNEDTWIAYLVAWKKE
ncbi:MAG: class I SAM-dependent methyltransferase [Planctomycetes bacterium]|nr:class I SAM-dependent methyltransferase [Planctomycetota bacterium]MCP4771956.1 class I SAM-dependent methyltransferase [Planctomycetota bacterium]MCP4860393.1 class I SAM-dependent methyltransferase [Planctomycetota bacterium]